MSRQPRSWAAGAMAVLTLTITACDDDASDGGDPDDDHREPATPRLVIADADSDDVLVVDAAGGAELARYPIPDATSVYAGETGRLAIVVGDDAVHFVDSGLWLDDHGDHVHREAQPPALATTNLTGAALGTARPVHVIAHHGHVTIHFDGTWSAEDPAASVPSQNVVLSEAALIAGRGEVMLALETAPQHGVSLVVGDDRLLLTAPSTDRARSALPNGVTVHALPAGELVQTIQQPDDVAASCWGLHGEAMVGARALFGCHESLDGGVLVVEPGVGGAYTSRKITYPGYPAATSRTSVIAGHPASRWAVGQWGRYADRSYYAGLVRIDPAADAIVDADVIDLGDVQCGFGFERSAGERVAALTTAGEVVVVDVAAWSVVGRVAAVPAGADGACPGAITVGEGAAYVSDPAGRRVVAVDLDDLATRSIAVAAAPGALAITGWWGQD